MSRGRLFHLNIYIFVFIIETLLYLLWILRQNTIFEHVSGSIIQLLVCEVARRVRDLHRIIRRITVAQLTRNCRIQRLKVATILKVEKLRFFSLTLIRHGNVSPT